MGEEQIRKLFRDKRHLRQIPIQLIYNEYFSKRFKQRFQYM